MRRFTGMLLAALLLLSVPVTFAQEAAETPPPVVDSQPAELNTSGELIVSEVLPADGSIDVEADSVITVIFNRPVVPLLIREEMDALPNPLTISPAIDGSGEWLNTSIYMFRPEPAFAGGLEYTVTVNAGLVAADGAALAENFSWTFSTIPPQIISIIPENLSGSILLDDPIQITFNQPMDRAGIESAFSMAAEADPNALVSGEFEWAEDNTGFRFTPAELLDLDTVYTVSINALSAQSEAGGAGLRGETAFSFSTVPYPAIINTSPFDGEQNVPPYGNFTIYFASPMEPDTLEDHIVIEPEPWREPDSYYSDWDNSYSLSFPAEPSADYTITILPGMEDIYGNPIQGETVVRFTTDAYDPSVALNVPGSIGFYNAYNEATQLFLTHRNISRVDLELYRVPLETFGQIITSDNYYDAPRLFAASENDLVRRWQITSTTPENQIRYELLDLGEHGSSLCESAPVSRLNVGDTAVVITDPDPLNARANPSPDAEILARLYRDYSLPVIAGPVCAEGYLWWQVRLRDEVTAWVAEGDLNEYFLDVRVAGQATPIELTEEGGGALPAGVYLLRASAPEFAFISEPQAHFAIVATANLALKVSIDSVLVWATDVNTGEPIAGAPITVYDQHYSQIGSGATDASGLLRIEAPRAFDLYQPRIAVLQNESHFGIGASQWSDGIEPYMFGQNFISRPEQFRTYVYTDRPIYRPDQPVYFRGVVRVQDDVTYTPPDFSFVSVQITNEEGEIVYDSELPLTPFGTFSDQFDLASDAPLGYYRISATLPGQPVDEYYYSDSGVIGFRVAEYRAPEFQVNVAAAATEVAPGDTIQVEIDSRYFFGGAVSNANVEYNVVSKPYYFEYEGAGSYSFIDFDYDGGPGEFYGGGSESIASGTGTTDEQGRLTIEIPAEIEDATQSQIFTIEAVVTDESAQAVAGRVDVIVHKGLIYVGVAPESYVSVAGEETNVNVIAVDWDSAGVAAQEVTYEIVERRWSSVQEEDPDGRTTWTWEVEEIPVTEGTVTTDADGKAQFAFTPPNGGIFKIRVRARDEAGSEVIAAQTMWVASSDYVTWRQQNSNRIDLIADDDSYQVGDTAQILITSPFQGTTEALVAVERGDVMLTEYVTMTSNSYVYELPITADFAPNIYVSVLMVKGVDENNPVAAFRMGMIGLGVDTSQKEITIDIAPSVEQAGPGDTVTYTVRTTNYAGEPVQAEVGVSLTDLSVLSIADPNSIPLMNFYYGSQGIAVRTSTPLTINTDQLTQTVLDTIKGGGGGFGEGGIFDIRQEFVDTPYWNAAVVTDENGEATFDVTLPDNLTTWRLDARAVTRGDDGLTLVGQDTFDLLSTKPLLIRPVTPRFFVIGDQVTLGAVVNNNTGDEQTVEVSLQASGVTTEDALTQTVTIPTGGRQRVDWTVMVDAVEAVDLTFFASGNDGAYTDASKPPLGQGDARLLPVYRYEAPETVGTGGVLREGETITEAIALPTSFAVTQGELTLALEPSLAATTLDSLDYLRNFPHQCIEQTVSRFLPNIMTYRALAETGQSNPELERDLEAGVNFALQRLYAAQKIDGGWGWFVQDNSNPLTTAYALIGLAEARAQGFEVSDQVIDSAANYLRSTLITPGLNQEAWRINRQAFVLYALARAGQPDVARTVSLYESRERLQYYSRAFLALTFHLIDPEDTTRTDVLMSDLINGATLSATGTHWTEAQVDRFNWNSDTRTTAIALSALVALRPESDLIPNVVRYLMVQRTADAWETTQETAWAVMALTDWMVASGELNASYSYSASLNGEIIVADTAVDPETVKDTQTLSIEVAELLADEANRLDISRTDGAGNLYYTAHLRAYLPVPEIDPLDAGIIVQRRYTLPEDPDTPIDTARVGDTVQVRLTVIVPADLHYIVIEDPIPAGSDAVDPGLLTSQQIGTQPELNPSDPLSRGWGWWYFSNIEFRDEKVVLYSTYLPAGTYEYVYSIRAGLPGVYNVIPTTGQEFYFPEVYGRGAGSTFTILP